LPHSRPTSRPAEPKTWLLWATAPPWRLACRAARPEDAGSKSEREKKGGDIKWRSRPTFAPAPRDRSPARSISRHSFRNAHSSFFFRSKRKGVKSNGDQDPRSRRRQQGNQRPGVVSAAFLWNAAVRSARRRAGSIRSGSLSSASLLHRRCFLPCYRNAVGTKIGGPLGADPLSRKTENRNERSRLSAISKPNRLCS
jgi:hypothetical protein